MVFPPSNTQFSSFIFCRKSLQVYAERRKLCYRDHQLLKEIKMYSCVLIVAVFWRRFKRNCFSEVTGEMFCLLLHLFQQFHVKMLNTKFSVTEKNILLEKSWQSRVLSTAQGYCNLVSFHVFSLKILLELSFFPYAASKAFNIQNTFPAINSKSNFAPKLAIINSRKLQNNKKL